MPICETLPVYRQAMSQQKISVGILFGGRSAEHEVSLQSAKNIFMAIDKEKYNPFLISIDKLGRWRLHNESTFLLDANDPAHIKLNTADTTALVPGSISDVFHLSKDMPRQHFDVIFPILHGTFGEDGTVQGLLKLANIPFVGASVLGSAVGMDKDVMKRLLRDAGLPIGKFLTFTSDDELPSYEEVENTLGIPCFIKPANLGSSVGISKVHNKEEYQKSIADAFQYDSKILIEEYIQGRELECAVLGNAHPIASVVGEIIPHHEFYSYEAKYIDAEGAHSEIPAKIPDETTKKVQALAIQTFKTLSCEGLGRVDFFLNENGEVFLNEINTLPGFTKISMYPKLWEASGVSYTDLIDRLIMLALERFKKEQKIQTNYLS